MFVDILFIQTVVLGGDTMIAAKELQQDRNTMDYSSLTEAYDLKSYDVNLSDSRIKYYSNTLRRLRRVGEDIVALCS